MISINELVIAFMLSILHWMYFNEKHHHRVILMHQVMMRKSKHTNTTSKVYGNIVSVLPILSAIATISIYAHLVPDSWVSVMIVFCSLFFTAFALIAHAIHVAGYVEYILKHNKPDSNSAKKRRDLMEFHMSRMTRIANMVKIPYYISMCLLAYRVIVSIFLGELNHV